MPRSPTTETGATKSGLTRSWLLWYVVDLTTGGQPDELHLVRIQTVSGIFRKALFVPEEAEVCKYSRCKGLSYVKSKLCVP